MLGKQRMECLSVTRRLLDLIILFQEQAIRTLMIVRMHVLCLHLSSSASLKVSFTEGFLYLMKEKKESKKYH